MNQKKKLGYIGLGAVIMLIGMGIGCAEETEPNTQKTEPIAPPQAEMKPVQKPEVAPVEQEQPPPVLVEPEQDIEEPEVVEPVPQPEEPEAVEPDPQPEPMLRQDAEAQAKFFLATNRERIGQRARDLTWNNPEVHPSQFYDQVYKEEFGIGIFFIMEVLLPILEEEQPKEKELGIFISEPFIVEYTILKFQHPDKNQDELLELFRVSAREGNISIIPGQQKPLLNQHGRKLEPNREGCVPKEWIGTKWLEDFLQAPLPEDPDPNLTNLNKARVLYKKYEQIRQELQQQNPNMDWNEIQDRAWKEAFGFNRAVHILIFNAYGEEIELNTFGIIGGYTLPSLLEYVRLSFEFPNEDPEGLLCLLRESVRAGNISGFPDNPKPWLMD